MINNFKSKIVSLFLNTEKGRKIEEKNNLKFLLKNKYKEFHFVNSEELNFYNLLVVNIENMFKSNEFNINENFIFKTKIDKIEGGSIDGSTYTEKEILFSIMKKNESKTIELLDETNKTLTSYCNTVWKYNSELLREKSQLLYGTDIENLLKKKIDKVLGKKILNISNRYEIYKDIFMNFIEYYGLDSTIKEKYIEIIDNFIENLKNSQIPKNMEVTIHNINYNGIFLFANEKELFLKKDQYKDFIKEHNEGLLRSEMEKLLFLIINQDEPLDLNTRQRYEPDGLLRFTIYKSKGDILYDGNYGLLLEGYNPAYRRPNCMLKKNRIEEAEYLIAMFGIEFSDYIKNHIEEKNLREANEQKNELDQYLLSNKNKVVNTVKRRL